MDTATKVPQKFDLNTTLRYRRQNMAKAMRGRIERGIVELITNCDDSYRDLEENGVSVPGKIRIDVERKRGTQCSILCVRDRAGGMSGEEMYGKLGTIGVRASGFELGKSRRGLYGRGAKDVAIFGCTHFESIKDDKYSHLIIYPSLTCEFKMIDKKASQDDRDRLGIPRGNGTVVTIEVNPDVVIPRHEKMIDQLSRYYSLRDIMSNPRREVVLIDQNSGRQALLTYKYPVGNTVVNKDIDILGYPEAKAHLTVRKHETSFQPDTSTTREGILVKSNSAIHDCTYFQLDSDVYCWRFTGELRCDIIDKLVREYDELELSSENPIHPTHNPVILLDPNRDGLVEEHPLAQGLKQQCRKILKNLVDTLKAEETLPKKKVSSARLDHKLGVLAKEISKIFEKRLYELEEELIPGSDLIGDMPSLPVGLHIIPPGEAPIIVNTPKSFTVKIVGYEELSESIPIDIVSSNSEAVIVRQSPVYLKRFSEDKKTASSTFILESDILAAESLIEVSYNGYSNVILVNTVPPPPPPQLPAGLSFEKPVYHIKVNKEKTLIIWLHSQISSANEFEAEISCDCPDIVIKGGGICQLKETKTKSIFMGKLRVLGRRAKAKGKIIAKTPTFAVAQCQAIVEETEGTHIKFKFTPDEEDFGTVRYKWDDINPYELRIAAKHPSVRQYLGAPADDHYPGIESELYHGVLAEIVAEALAFNLLEKQFKVEGQQGLLDFTTVDANYHKNYSDFLTICHKTLNSDYKVQTAR